LWPAKVIADILAAAGLGASVLPCVQRVTAVRKSSSSPAKDRPSVAEHYESLGVTPQLLRPAQITLVDDVLTQGRTMVACALRLAETFPDAQIRCFAMIRTQGFVENFEKIIDPSTGVIHYYDSGKTFREP
jgi:predicted amidophosphoribosyltransferase